MMTNRKLSHLSIVLIIASILIIGATQRFDKIIAKSIVTTSSSGITLNGGGALDMASGGLTLDSGDVTLTAGDLTVVAGDLAITAGDASIGGRATMETWLNLTAQTAISLTAGATITPTGSYQVLTSAAEVTTSTTIPIASGTTNDLLILRNGNASDIINIDGTGGTVECKSDIAMGASDTLTLIWNGTDWNCLSSYDNS